MGNGIFQNHSGKGMGNGQSENGRTLLCKLNNDLLFKGDVQALSVKRLKLS